MSLVKAGDWAHAAEGKPGTQRSCQTSRSHRAQMTRARIQLRFLASTFSLIPPRLIVSYMWKGPQLKLYKDFFLILKNSSCHGGIYNPGVCRENRGIRVSDSRELCSLLAEVPLNLSCGRGQSCTRKSEACPQMPPSSGILRTAN